MTHFTACATEARFSRYANAPNNQQQQTTNQNSQQQQQKLKDKVGHGCTVVSGLLVLGDAAILFSGQEYLAPWSLSVSAHVWAAFGWLTW